MTLSIIIPVYNAEKFIDRAVSSLLVHKEEGMEIILVNDGSTDGSLKKCQKWAEQDKRISIVNKKNGGVSSARNAGMEVSKGKYLMFLDADDYMKADWWECVKEYLSKDLDFVGFSYDSYFNENLSIEERYPGEDLISNKKEISHILLASPYLHTCWSKLFKRDIIKEYNIMFPTDMAIGEDYYFVLEYMKKTKSAILINKSILYYLQNDSGAMGNFKYEKRIQAIENMHKFCFSYARETDASKDLIRDMQTYYYRSFTKLLRDIGNIKDGKKRSKIYKRLFSEPIIRKILSEISAASLSKFKKMEYYLIKTRNVCLINLYFRFKVCGMAIARGRK